MLATATPTLPLTESNDIQHDAGAMALRLRRDGYLFFRELLPRRDVMEVRRQVLETIARFGWTQAGTDPIDGITDHEPIEEADERYRAPYAEIQKLEAFHKLKLHANVAGVMRTLFQEEVTALPNTIARVAFPIDNQRITQPHQDWLYIQGSVDTMSCWAPLGDLPEEVGGLRVLAGSHKAGVLFPKKAGGPGGHTVPIDPTLEWRSAEFRAGDVLTFPALTIHAAKANVTPDRIRLSMDFRYIGLSHAVSQSNLPPHCYWHGEPFSWPTLSKDWKDKSPANYWEKLPLKAVPHDHRMYQLDK